VANDAEQFTSVLREHWGEVAQAFHEGLSSLTDSCIPRLLASLGEIRGLRVLDVGCGPGHSTAEIARRGAAVVGTDLAPPMVALAAKVFPKIDFQVADVEELPFPDASFDAACGNFVILLISRPERAAAELARVLKPGGRVALSTWDVDARNRVLGMLGEALEASKIATPSLPGAPEQLRFADDAEFERLLRGAGFEQIKIERFGFAFEAPSADALFTELTKTSRTVRAAIASGDTAAVERLRMAYVRLAERYARDGRVAVPCSAKIASGRI
jgi:SAM-dependent methyltransferase